MMPGLPDEHPSIRYYDSDYPGTETSTFPENIDETLTSQGLLADVARFKELASNVTGEILELGCGTGRVLIPLARAGHRITGVDLSKAMIATLEKRISKENKAIRERVTYYIADARNLVLDRKYDLIIFPFNGLSCIPDFRDQQKAIFSAASLLNHDGRLVIDLVNPLALPLKGSDAPRPFFTRRHHDTGNIYTRFAAMGPIKADQTQDLFGWYDEIDSRNMVRRTPYKMTWRLIFRYEIELMVKQEGLTIDAIEGDHMGSDFSSTSPKIFLIARKPVL